MSEPKAIATSGVLDKIVRRRRERLGEPAAGEWQPAGRGRAEPLTAAENRLLAALAARRGRAVIAEVKMGSPRLGSLAGRVDPERQSAIYARHGAAALSVVTEPDFFFGGYGLLASCRSVAGLPTLAKDFVVSPRQLEWAAEAGADAVLLIVALYDADQLAALAARARYLGLAPLVEVHGLEDLRKLEGRDWELVGLNSRDLRTFEVRLDHSIRLLPLLPAAPLKVAESGIGGAADAARLRRAGFDAFLVGESLLLAADPAAKLRELTG